MLRWSSLATGVAAELVVCCREWNTRKQKRFLKFKFFVNIKLKYCTIQRAGVCNRYYDERQVDTQR